MGCSNEDWAVFWCSLLESRAAGRNSRAAARAVFSGTEPRGASAAQRPAAADLGAHLASPVAAAEGRRGAGLVSPPPFRSGKAAEEARRLVGPRRGPEEGAAAPLRRSDQSHLEAGVRVARSRVPPSTGICGSKGPRGGSWASRRKKSAAAGPGTSPGRCGSATSSTARW